MKCEYRLAFVVTFLIHNVVPKSFEKYSRKRSYAHCEVISTGKFNKYLSYEYECRDMNAIQNILLGANMEIDDMTILKEKIFTNDPKIIFVMPMNKIILNMKQTKCRKVFQLDLW